MANRKTKIGAIGALALIIAAAVTWYVASPAWTLRQMKAAADANDPSALNAYVDYPALREDLKAQITGRIMSEARKDQSGFGGLGVAIGTAVVGPLVDGLVSPAAVSAALMARHDQVRSGLSSQASSALRVPDKPVIVRRGLSEFVVSSKQQPASGLVFKRHGLSWKLSGVELPPDGAPGTESAGRGLG